MASLKKSETLYYPVGWEKMSEEEQHAWARSYAELVLNAVEKEMGYLPPPPSREEFSRLWNKLAREKGLLSSENEPQNE